LKERRWKWELENDVTIKRNSTEWQIQVYHYRICNQHSSLSLLLWFVAFGIFEFLDKALTKMMATCPRFRCWVMKTRIPFGWSVPWKEGISRCRRWLWWWSMCFRGFEWLRWWGCVHLIRSTTQPHRTRNCRLSRTTRTTAVALTIGLCSCTRNTFPCATTKPDCRN
jgi:hypothetical protein